MRDSAETLEACSGDAKNSRESGGVLLLASADRAMLMSMKSVWKPSIRMVLELHSWLRATWHTSSRMVAPNEDHFSTFIPAAESQHKTSVLKIWASACIDGEKGTTVKLLRFFLNFLYYPVKANLNHK